MPEICRFYGIVIKMYFADHAPPHFHAEYAEFEARIAIDSLAVISGAHSSHRDHLVQTIVITHSSDRDRSEATLGMSVL